MVYESEVKKYRFFKETALGMKQKTDQRINSIEVIEFTLPEDDYQIDFLEQALPWEFLLRQNISTDHKDLIYFEDEPSDS